MVAKYQKEHEVAYYECDINQTMTFPAMLGVAIKVSEEQSAVLSVGQNTFALWTDMDHYYLPYHGQSVADGRGTDHGLNTSKRIQ